MNYCSECGAKVEHRIPEGDNRVRQVCDHCDTIHYQNPKIVAGCIPEWEQKILLCRRAIEPRHGLWTLPAGFMENGETTLAAAERETYEEALAKLTSVQFYAMYSLPHINQVYMMYRGELVDGQAAPGSESLEVQLFAEADIPWNELAFPVMNETLELYFADRRAGLFPVRTGDLIRMADKTVQLTRH